MRTDAAPVSSTIARDRSGSWPTNMTRRASGWSAMARPMSAHRAPGRSRSSAIGMPPTASQGELRGLERVGQGRAEHHVGLQVEATQSGAADASPRVRARSARERHRPSSGDCRPCRGAGSRGSRHVGPAPRRSGVPGDHPARVPGPLDQDAAGVRRARLREAGSTRTPLPYVTLARRASTAHGRSIVRSYGPYDHSRGGTRCVPAPRRASRIGG